MSEWIWGCMILSFKAGIGVICWTATFWIFIAIVAGIAAGIASVLEK